MLSINLNNYKDILTFVKIMLKATIIDLFNVIWK